MSVFHHYARYYDLLYRDKDYAGETSFVAQLIETHAPSARRLLELGCGTGRHAVEFAERGFQVRGIDRSPAMIARATARCGALPESVSSRLSFETGDACSFRGEDRYDAVVALFHVMSYQTQDEDLARCLATAARALDPGGLFVFDCWYGPAVVHLRPESRVLHLEDEATRLVRRAEPGWDPERNRVDVHYTIEIEDKASGEKRAFDEIHPMRYLFLPEIGSMAAAAGLDLIESGAWMTGAPLSANTWNAYAVTRLGLPAA